MGEVPADEGALMQSVLNDPEAKYNSADLNVALQDARRRVPAAVPHSPACSRRTGASRPVRRPC